MVSKKFRESIKLSNKRQYEIAHEAGLHPSVLSRIICGIDKTKPGDSRVLKIAKVLGLQADECF